jgi:MoaA/NifB/PqqE/SkfB family radical SAM enzyme
MIMTLLNAILSPLFCHNFDQTQSISTILRHSRYRISAGNTETSLNPAQVSKTIRANSAILNTGTNVQNQSATSAASFIFKVLSSRYNPLLAQMVVTRRCNLSCGYCNEYDDFSPPVPTELLIAQVDKLAELHTAAITCTGGEPLMHPDLEKVVARIREHGIIATMISNGFRLSADRIKRLNDSGLQEMQISIDNLKADEVSMKSLESVERKLVLLAEHARFKVNINSVLGISDDRTDDVMVVARKAREYGFFHTVGVLHNESGILKPLTDKQFTAYRQCGELSGAITHKFNYHLFQKNLIQGKPNNWKCRAGARYLYICEEGKVHWCSQQRGYPGIPLLDYTREDIKREYKTEKACAPKCTLGCVHQMSAFDELHSRQTLPDPTI